MLKQQARNISTVRDYGNGSLRTAKFMLMVTALLALVACGPSRQQLIPTLTAEAYIQDVDVLWNAPTPLPDFIRKLEFWHSTVLDALCIQIDISQIWEPGDYSADTYSIIEKSLHLEIDRDAIAQENMLLVTLGMTTTRRDDQGNVAGSHGGDESICISVDGLADGTHGGWIRFHSTSRKEYNYRWAFKTLRQGEKVTIELPALLD